MLGTCQLRPGISTKGRLVPPSYGVVVNFTHNVPVVIFDGDRR
jgi:hypothetical protein